MIMIIRQAGSLADRPKPSLCNRVELHLSCVFLFLQASIDLPVIRFAKENEPPPGGGEFPPDEGGPTHLPSRDPWSRRLLPREPAAGIGRHYLSSTASFASCAAYSVKDRRNLPNCSPLSKKTCVRQVVLDKWFPPEGSGARSPGAIQKYIADSIVCHIIVHYAI